MSKRGSNGEMKPNLGWGEHVNHMGGSTMLQQISTRYLFFLSATPFCCGVLAHVD